MFLNNWVADPRLPNPHRTRGLLIVHLHQYRRMASSLHCRNRQLEGLPASYFRETTSHVARKRTMVYNMRAACSKSSDVRELESGCSVEWGETARACIYQIVLYCTKRYNPSMRSCTPLPWGFSSRTEALCGCWWFYNYPWLINRRNDKRQSYDLIEWKHKRQLCGKWWSCQANDLTQ